LDTVENYVVKLAYLVRLFFLEVFFKRFKIFGKFNPKKVSTL
jgi:hypothetical protein